MGGHENASVGFIGLGTMGRPMALNLVRAGTPLVVWNRTTETAVSLAEAGATVASGVVDLLQRTKTVILMLPTGEAIDAVLERGSARIAAALAGHRIVNMGTVLPAYSRDLDRNLRAAGASYVEAPVSGQKGPAEAGQLVAMLAGDEQDLEAVEPLLAAMCRRTLVCGSVPEALSMKLALTVYQGTLTAGLAEAVNFARRQGLDLELFSDLLNAGPMACDLVRMKMPKLIDREFGVQASLDNTIEVIRLVLRSAEDAGIAIPLASRSHSLYSEARELGTAEEDVMSVLRVFENASSPSRRPRGS